MDSPDDFRFLKTDFAGCFNPLQEGEYITCQTYPQPRKSLTEDGCLDVLNLKYRGEDFKEAWRIAQADNMGRDYSSAGVCQLIDGCLKVLNYRGEPCENLAKSPSDYDYD